MLCSMATVPSKGANLGSPTESSTDQECLTKVMIFVQGVLIEIDGEPLSLVGNLLESGIPTCTDPSYKQLFSPLQSRNNLKQSTDEKGNYRNCQEV